MELIALLDKMEEKIIQLESVTREGGASADAEEEAAVELTPEEEDELLLTDDDNLSSTASTLGGSTQELNALMDDRGEDFVDVETLDEEEQTWNWSASFRERQFNMLKFGFFTDFSILVGPNNNPSDSSSQQEKEPQKKKKEEERLIKVHKSMLASSSPVFYNEILKAMSDGKKELQVSDDPRTFILFLRVIIN
jgi:hypothetical protein